MVRRPPNCLMLGIYTDFRVCWCSGFLLACAFTIDESN